MKRTLSLFLKALLAAALLAYLIHFIDVDAIVASAATADPAWILTAALLLPLNLLAETTVWYRLLRPVAPQVRPRPAFGALLCGYALGAFTPARAGEFAGRAFYLRHADKWELSAVVFVQRMLDMIVAVGVGTLALAFFLRQQALAPEAAWWGLVVFGTGMTFTLGLLALLPRQTYHLGRRLLRKETIYRRFAFLQRLSSREMALLLGVGLLRYGVYSTAFVLLLHAFAPEAPAGTSYLGVALVFLAKFLIPSITLTDLGVREGAAVFFLGRLGLPEAAAFNASLLIFTLNLLVPALAGLPFVFRMRLQRHEIPEPQDH